MDKSLFNQFVYIWIIIALILFPILLKITAPYGRHSNREWGMTVPNRLGWVVMELPALLVFVYFFLNSTSAERGISWMFLVLWVFHYTNRSIVFPIRIRTSGKSMPIVIVFFALIFNAVNGYINGFHFGVIKPVYTVSWLTDIRFLTGIILFVGGMVINWYSDKILIELRKNSRNGYKTPYGFLFRYVSCPNFLGELIEWIGFAILTWSLPALAFVIWSFTNLIPRALDHHRWYHRKFENYPENRKAIIPFIL